jgi:hypothetical protein
MVKRKKVTFIQCIQKNKVAWLCVLISVAILSFPNILHGILTFVTAMIISYVFHYQSHKKVNIFNIIHHYHHSHDTLLSHFTQILTEFISLSFILPLFYLKSTILDPWILLFYTLFYSSIHNINYSYVRVNKVHSLHHKHVLTNIGPDILDVLFGTKNKKEKCVEDISHYIPNTIVSCFIIVGLQYLWKKNDKMMMKCMYTFIGVSLIILITFSIYLNHLKNNHGYII